MGSRIIARDALFSISPLHTVNLNAGMESATDAKKVGDLVRIAPIVVQVVDVQMHRRALMERKSSRVISRDYRVRTYDFGKSSMPKRGVHVTGNDDKLTCDILVCHSALWENCLVSHGDFIYNKISPSLQINAEL